MRNNPVILTASIVAVLLCATLGVCEAYKAERLHAIARAVAAQQQSVTLLQEQALLDDKNRCNTLWLEYKTADLKNQIARLRRQPTQPLSEPPCSGYAAPLDESLAAIRQASQLGLDAIAQRQSAVFERNYSTNRALQTRVLALRLRALLTFSNLKQSPAQMQAAWESSHPPRA